MQFKLEDVTRFWKFGNIATNNDGERVGDIVFDGVFLNNDYMDWYPDDVYDRKFRADIAEMGVVDVLNIHINSPGGDVFTAMTIRSILSGMDCRKVAIIEGLAASAATIPITACDHVVMHRGAMMMVHCASTFTAGNAKQLAKDAEDLAKVDAAILACYAEHTGKDEEELRELMEKETWMSAEECVALGFADEVYTNEPVVAAVNESNPNIWCIAGAMLDMSGLTIRPTAMLAVNSPTPDPSPAGEGNVNTEDETTSSNQLPLSSADDAPSVTAVTPPSEMEALVGGDVVDLAVGGPTPNPSPAGEGNTDASVLAERQRIVDILGMAEVGTEAIIQAAIADGSEPGVVAQLILAASRERRALEMQNLLRAADGQESGVNDVKTGDLTAAGGKEAQASAIVEYARNFLAKMGKLKN